MSVQSPNELDKNIGAKIKEYRLLNGLTQQYLANRIGVTYQQLHKYEQCQNRISASRLCDVCEILNVSIVEIVGQEDIPVDERTSMRKQLITMKLFNNVNEDVQDAVIKILRSVQLEN